MAVLELTDVTVQFGGLTAVKDCTFRVDNRGITCLVGPNGAGKTTIFNAITGFVKPTRGSIKLNGIELVGKIPEKISRLGIGRTFQNVRLFHEFTVLQNVLAYMPNLYGQRVFESLLFPKKVRKEIDVAKEKALHLLEQVGLNGKEHVLAANLPYGDQKLLIIARVLAMEPEVIMLDEPTSGLDHQSFEKVVQVIRNLAKNESKTILLIEHNMDTVRKLADRVLFLEQGTVIGDGTAEEIMADPRLTDLYFGITRGEKHVAT